MELSTAHPTTYLFNADPSSEKVLIRENTCLLETAVATCNYFTCTPGNCGKHYIWQRVSVLLSNPRFNWLFVIKSLQKGGYFSHCIWYKSATKQEHGSCYCVHQITFRKLNSNINSHHPHCYSPIQDRYYHRYQNTTIFVKLTVSWPRQHRYSDFNIYLLIRSHHYWDIVEENITQGNATVNVVTSYPHVFIKSFGTLRQLERQ